MVTIKNVHNGSESQMTAKDWEAIQKNPKYAGRYELVGKPETPNEVKHLEKPTVVTKAETKSAEGSKDSEKK